MLKNLGFLYLRSKKERRAFQCFDILVSMHEFSTKSNVHLDVDLCSFLGYILLYQSEFEKAKRLFLSILKMENLPTKLNPQEIAKIYSTLGGIEEKL